MLFYIKTLKNYVKLIIKWITNNLIKIHTYNAYDLWKSLGEEIN